MFEQKLDRIMNTWQAEENSLVQGNRKDEAAFVRIRMNVAGIGKTVWQVVCRTEKPEDRKRVFLGKMEALRTAWQESHARAEKYQDRDKAMIEEIKMDTLDQVLRAFEECAQ